MAAATQLGLSTPQAAPLACSSSDSAESPFSSYLSRMACRHSVNPVWGSRPQRLPWSQARCLIHRGAASPLGSSPALHPSFSPCLLSCPVLDFCGIHRKKFRFSAQAKQQTKGGNSAPASKVQEDVTAIEDGDPDVEISWMQEKGEDIAFYATTAVQAIPGPRVGQSGLPWLLAVPLAYAVITFVLATVKTIRKLNSPREKRRRQIGKNATLNESLSEYLPSNRLELTPEKVQDLAKKCDFSSSEIVRKYIRYALNERPFNTDTVADLIHLKNVGSVPDKDVPEILNEVSRRIVKAKGPVVMDTRGFTAKGLERKITVQALFKKLLYLSELEDFCPASVRTSLEIKGIFGVTDEDADSIRFDTLSEVSDMDTLEKMVSTSGGHEEEAQES